VNHPINWRDIDKVVRPHQLKYRVDLPEGRKGGWSVERFTVPKPDKVSFQEFMLCLHYEAQGRSVPPGTYTRLMRSRNGSQQRDVIMSDTPAEITDHIEFLNMLPLLGGRVLVHGLGLGMAIKAALAVESVTHIDVVEIDRDLIDLVGPHYEDERLTIHHGDALKFKWPTGSRWDLVWHDIWDSIDSDNIRDMKWLHRSFGHRCRWQGSWARCYVDEN